MLKRDSSTWHMQGEHSGFEHVWEEEFNAKMLGQEQPCHLILSAVTQEDTVQLSYILNIAPCFLIYYKLKWLVIESGTCCT